jgi:hypothetical protein
LEQRFALRYGYQWLDRDDYRQREHHSAGRADYNSGAVSRHNTIKGK